MTADAAQPEIIGRVPPQTPRRRRHLFQMPQRLPTVAKPAQKQAPGAFFANMVKAGSGMMSPYRFRFRAFKAKVPLQVEIKDFIVKTVDSAAELEKILRLRYKVFYAEYCDRKRLFAIDLDEFDVICDHLMILDKRSGACVGTYRLNSSLFNTRFYSETEFNIAPILALPGVKLELGRACVHKDFRGGMSLALLWRGMSEYVKQTQTRYLFGCSSVKTTEPLEIAVVRRHLFEHHAATPTLHTTPQGSYTIKGLALYNALADLLDDKTVQCHAKELIPPLLHSYLKAGAVICSEPALDLDFNCVDFLTLLDLTTTTDAIERKFL